MYSQFEPTVKATIFFLKLMKVKVNNTTVSETLQNHPDWPSLLSIGDSLNKWGVPNGAGRLVQSDIDQLTVPFIANIHNKEYPIAIVSYVDDKNVHYYLNDYSKPILETKELFLKKWTGVYLIAEPNEGSGEKNYSANKRKALRNLLIPALLLVLLTSLSFLRLYEAQVPIGVYLQYFIFFAGVVVTILLLWYEIDKSNPILQKVCTGIAKGNCNAILSGKHAKLFGWLSWSEIGFFYFMGGVLVLLFLPNSIGILAWFVILALPYTLFSIYYQWQVARQWCLLCLCVQALLLLGGVNVLTTRILSKIFIFPISLTIKTILLYTLPALVWYTIKPYILGLQEAKNTKREYLRMKFNGEIFNTLLKKQKSITISTDGLGIDLGNRNARNVLIKVCNPYCGPCARAHPDIEKLLDENPDLKVKIIFTASNNEENILAQPVKHLLAIAEKSYESITKHALNDWYLAEKKDYETFAKKYPMNGELLHQGNKLDAMRQWVETLGIQSTPTIFINGYQLPDPYNIGDLQYFLLE